MAIDWMGIKNINEYYTNHYLTTVFEENISEIVTEWNEVYKEADERPPWSLLREAARQYYVMHDRSTRGSIRQLPILIQEMADIYLSALGYADSFSTILNIDDESNKIYIYREEKKQDGSPLLWVLLSHNNSREIKPLLEENNFQTDGIENNYEATNYTNEELASKIFFNLEEAPRWLIIIGKDSIALLDRNKWNEKRYLEFDLEEMFSRREDGTFKAVSLLLHKESLCPTIGSPLVDSFDENSHKHASGVSQDLKYALRESIELLGNEVIYDMKNRQGIDLEQNPVDGEVLSLQCLRYMYRLLFLLFIEAKPELGYTPNNSQAYKQGYSLENLRDIVEATRQDIEEVGEGYYLQESLSLLFELVYNGYPSSSETLKELSDMDSYHHVFILEPLKAHIFDPNRTLLLTQAKIRNSTMLRIIELMSITRDTGRRNERRGRISYSNLGINQMGAAYEALLSYRGFIAEEILFEVKRERDQFNELDVGYFVPESQLDNYSEEERVRYPDGSLRKYEKGEFIYRLAGREREKSASYYTPEVLTRTLVKYALKELLEDKNADDILKLKICEPAMGSAAFLNEAINQLAEAYLDLKQKELNTSIPHDKRSTELQRVKMYIADKNVYGIDLNPIAVELAEVSLWLNTIYEGAYVPWFNTQLVCGNSLIGARKECYRIEQLETSKSGIRWYDNAPDRVPLGTDRMAKKQVYHFLTGDPGMANYTDKVIKSLAEENLKKINSWNKDFIKPYSDDEIQNLQRLSKIIDDLWEKQVELRKEVDRATSDELIVYGQAEGGVASHTSIKEKDYIYRTLYKSEEQKNAGAYARLRFAMDYWCSLWFWPIEDAELLPSRSEFIADMYLILEGTIDTLRGVSESFKQGQQELFPTEKEQMILDFQELYLGMGIVDIAKLCQQQPRLALVKKIAKEQKFLHWELEFADLFKDNGGFDLIIGNPPWIKPSWNERDILSDFSAIFAIKNLKSNKTAEHRKNILKNTLVRESYFNEYEGISGLMNFLNANQTYSILKGQQMNLYKCFLPQGWMYCSEQGVSSYIHPDGVYDEPRGGILREELYNRLRMHFQFINELKLFPEVDHHTVFSINLYGKTKRVQFISISNLFSATTIDQCFEKRDKTEIKGIKDENNNWNTEGHPDRVVKITEREMKIFSKMLDGDSDWRQARLPALHAQSLVDVMEVFNRYPERIGDLGRDLFSSMMWHETYAQNDKIITREVSFPKYTDELIYSGPHIGVANPLFKCSRRECRLNSDYDSIDLLEVNRDYLQRNNYSVACTKEEYNKLAPRTSWGDLYHDKFKLLSRAMINKTGERSLVSCIGFRGSSHINGILGLVFKDYNLLCSVGASFASIPFDFFIKITGMGNLRISTVSSMPLLRSVEIRYLLLISLSSYYEELYKAMWKQNYTEQKWSKIDERLRNEKFMNLTSEWIWETPFRTDYERRQALVEIDVLTALTLGMTLNQLKTIYRIQFPVLQQYEADTWYDRNGRIVFTNNRGLSGVGFSRKEFEEIKEAKTGEIFSQKIIDDTMPGGPVERTIEYVAPFDRCDREEDYETAWKFFEEKYKDK